MPDNLLVYDGERKKRWPFWYIFFTSVIVFLIVYSFFQWWLMWWISVLFIFLVIVVSYIILYLRTFKKIKIVLNDNYFLVWDKTYAFSELLWVNAEYDEKTWKFLNFILVPQSTAYPLKYTIAEEDMEKVGKFISNVLEKIAVYSDYENDRLYKVIQTLKL